MAISRPKSIGISLIDLSCAELKPIGLLPSMSLVHLLVRARCWGQLGALVWARDRRDSNTFVLNQEFLISVAIALAARTHLQHVHCHPRILPT
jgi:hypothetical protein